MLDTYLPSIQFNNVDINPFDYIREKIVNSPVPVPIIKGTYSPDVLNIYCKQKGIFDLHLCFENPDFQDIMFDSDLRRKLDGMSLSSVFRKTDIVREFPDKNVLMLNTYLDCFANFKDIQYKNVFVNNYYGDYNEQRLMRKVLDNTSRQYLKVLLGLKLVDISPKDQIENAINIVNLKLQEAFLTDNNADIDKWIKLQVSISEKLHKMGSGNRSALDDLKDVLQAEKDFDEPIIYTKEQLEEEYQNNQNK